MKMKYLLLILFAVCIIFSFPGCNNLENSTTSASKLIVESLTGKDLAGEEGSTTIFSDVITEGSVFNDNGVAALTAVLLDPFACTGTCTYYQSILVDQVDIVYSRADGLNTPGVDVPYGFSQKVNMLVGIGEKISLPFVLIQHNAKLESPLVELVNIGQEKILKLEAEVTFHGKDLGGHRVESAKGHVSVWCSNFADSTE